MANNIGWCDLTRNPLIIVGGGHHCTRVSDGCENCWAEKFNARFWPNSPYDDRDVEFELNLSVFDTLPKKKPKRVFVQSMGDLFHRRVTTEMLGDIWERMASLPHHTFIILTKRPENIAEKLYSGNYLGGGDYLPNVWLGVSCENQEMADLRIPQLLEIPAAKHFVSIEPMLGEIDMRSYLHGFNPKNDTGKMLAASLRACPDPGINYNTLDGIGKDQPFPYLDWVIAGEETGPGKRPCDPDWVRSIRDQCVAANVPFYLKKINGKRELDGRTWSMIPE